MDPLSITASILTVVGVGAEVAKALRRLIQLRGAPAALTRLNEEVHTLQNTVQDFDILLRYYYGENCNDLPATVRTTLHRAQETALALKCLITYDLSTISTSRNDLRVDKSRWLRAEQKISSMREDIKMIKVEINTSLSILSANLAAQNRSQLHKISVAIDDLNPYSKQFQQSLLQLTVASSLGSRTALGIDTDDGDGAWHKDERSKRARNNVYLGSDDPQYLRIQELDLDSTGTVQGEKTLSQTQHFTESMCGTRCICRCHTSMESNDPKLLAALFGFFWESCYKGGTSLPNIERCDLEDCQKRPKKPSYTYTIPLWWTNRKLLFMLSRNSFGGPELCLRTLRVISRTSRIFIAAEAGKTEHVKRLLIDGDGSVIDVDQHGQLALQKAVDFMRIDTAELLIQAGSDTLYENKYNLSAYTIAWGKILGKHSQREAKDLDRLRKLFSDTSKLGSLRFSPLHNAYFGISGETFDSCLSTLSRSAIDTPDASGRSILSWAAERGDFTVLNLLLRCGADPDRPDNRGCTPLHWSTYTSKVDCTESLLSANANASSKDKYGRTPLIHAASHQHDMPLSDENFLKCLLARGAYLEERDSQGFTSLHWAAWKGQPGSLSYLLDCGADINAVNYNHGNTPIFLAINRNHHVVLQILLCNPKLKTDAINFYGHTVLHHAAQYADLETLGILERSQLTHIDPDAVNLRGMTAQDYAVYRHESNGLWPEWALRTPDDNPGVWFRAFLTLLHKLRDIQHAAEPILNEELGKSEGILEDSLGFSVSAQ